MRTMHTVIAIACLALLGAETAHAQTRHRGFSVVLLLGETQGTSPSEEVPPAVRKALADVKDFLPYKSYRMLESQLVLGAKTATARMRGLGDQEYDVEINADEIMPNPLHYKEGMLNVLFKLQEVGAATSPGEEFSRSMALNGLEQQRAAFQTELNNAAEGAKKGIRDALASIDKSIRMARARKLIDSRFEMAVAETVVVGTSKIAGDKGLVVLLTAVPASGK